jgi:hypothetical protein
MRVALTALYGFYRASEPMLANSIRDEPHVASLQELMRPMWGYLAAVRELLLRGRRERGRRRVRVTAVVAHAVDFGAWRSLARGGLRDEEIVVLMVDLAAGASRGKLP